MNWSKHANFSEDELDALDTWTDLETFGEGRSEPVADEETRILTVDEIEAMQKQAYDEAFEQGRQEGVEQGRKEGIQEGKESGFKQGFDEGAKKGYQDNVHLLRKQTAEFVSLLESLAEPFKYLDDRVEQELVELSIGIASQLVRREIKVDPGQIVAVVKEAVGALPLANQKITLTLHPEDAELVRSALVLDEMSPPWGIQEDPLLTRGGCRVETGASHVDATVENRLAAIVAKVLGGERREDRTA
ncbi:flagellar assembly protein FliH [Methylomarinum sp. Ch1-1]|uniref:Flagellar assembly protein FliH n=1 Tax=Methylomarinum roseum TaxID=3067653 RepID=A0AAU7NTN0_9GAMM|nr:flagellar assembly protein FliH [Methylomarinum sp. Ch1-1]MDP4519625.1 flagellar assembly protein FliH [Methylomarinum sp. Ch1-1]